jgi:glutamate synthase (NADPH/NADH) large chain
MSSCGVGFVCDTKGTKSRKIVELGIEAVKNLTHRGAVGGDGKTGDGAGVLIQIPRRFFLKEIARSGFRLSSEENLAVGVFFFYETHGALQDIESSIETILIKFGFRIIGWRDVPTDDAALGNSALSAKPWIKHLLVDMENVGIPKRGLNLFLARRAIERTLGTAIYIPSLSSRTIIYKGMLVAPQLDRFYPDLNSEDFETAFCIFHQRFSTNTFPDWTMAQPLRTLAHNGEINTIQGNRNWMVTMEQETRHEIFGDDDELIRPLLSMEESDSSSLDRIVELLMLAGYSPEHAITLCVPPAWENAELNEQEKAFLEYQSFLMKPWDGPAAIAFTSGDTIGAHLDRNGLRPLRYLLTEDGIIVLGSETGMVDIGGRRIKNKGRLGPGDTLSVNMSRGEVRFTDEILKELSGQRSYREWTDRSLYRVRERTFEAPQVDRDLTRKQVAFGYTSEEIRTSLREMAEKGKEMTFSMGDDTPLPPLSEKPQLLFRYFKQRFSQVTNPPIDPIRERTVMSLRMAIGYKRNFLHETAEHARRIEIDSPILSGSQVREIEGQQSLKVVRLPITYAGADAENPPDDMPGKGLMTCCVPGKESLLLFAVRGLQRRVVDAVRNGAEVIILTDGDVSPDRIAIPSLLAVSSSFKALQKERIANRASIIIESAEPRDIHQMACLIGYGASAVHPYLALLTIKEICDTGMALPFEQAALNYRTALEDGLLKVMARMGISTLNSYYAAQLFDTVCLNQDFVDEFFKGSPVTIESDGVNEIEESLMKRHLSAFGTGIPVLDYGGNLKYRKGGEWHQWSTSAVIALNRFVKDPENNSFRDFSRIADERPVFIRHLLSYKKAGPLPVEEVEPEEQILRRFFSGAMSVGALSPEAHEVIAEACNTLCIRSNSGEGGEDPLRYWTIKNSAIKQIASGRFGVTPAYLASASELEIKIAQGAKPGEGGHLPANKVTKYIAMLRHCSPNILLISPPPHHDIYSIEDLAQLINDLKEANPKAKVCVKLVSETGVGAVAAGVAKSYADIVQISGCEGGTGASPIGSIKNAGNYWETGLAETQRVLIENGLRERIRVRVDGGIRTGRDIVLAALLGAEEFGFGTAAMIATGCVMARQCHLNTCPTGIATQDERLRAKFTGTVEGLTAYFTAVAREVREILAGMGFRRMGEIIGRSDLLVPHSPEGYPASKRIRLDRILGGYSGGKARKSAGERNDNPAESMNRKLLDDLLPHIERARPVSKEYEIRNIHRSVPLTLNYHIALRYKDEGLPPDTLNLTFRGTAGQSFGAFNHRGISLTLIGDANDYAGKGMFGGRIVIRPADGAGSPPQVVAGNTVLYGATGGEFFAAGEAGERFAVRNSGAVAVVEGTGHHLCEYMTRGTVVVLGEVGQNVGAGMTGGVIYVFDHSSALEGRLSRSYVKVAEIEEEREKEELKSLIDKHCRYTGSPLAGKVLGEFERALGHFRKVVPL